MLIPGVGVFMESLVSIVSLIYLVYVLKRDAQNREPPPAPKPPPALDCIPEPWATNVELNHSSATKVPEPLPYDTIKAETGILTHL